MSEVAAVQGRRSPRWALWSRMVIPCRDGIAYLARLRIVQTPWLAVYVHDIYEPDADRDPHNHPWSFVSVVLSGYYVERVYDEPETAPHRWRSNHWRRFSAHRMGRGSAHRIIEAGPGLKTLILAGPRKSGWGFYVDGSYVPWQEYEHEEAVATRLHHHRPLDTNGHAEINGDNAVQGGETW